MPSEVRILFSAFYSIKDILKSYGTKDYSPNKEGNCYIAVPIKINEPAKTRPVISMGSTKRND